MWHRLQAVVLLAASVLVLRLAVQQDLDIYIHPRYIWFTVIAAAVSALLATWALLRPLPKVEGRVTAAVLCAVIAAGLTLDAAPLSSATASQRGNAQRTEVSLASPESAPLAQLFASSAKNLTLKDWVRLTQANPSASYYTGRTATVSGFVYDNMNSSDYFTIARFVVTCCAVDAQPIGLVVYQPDWQSTYPVDSWVEATGTFADRQVGNGSGTTLSLVPQRITAIGEPEDPYAN